MLRIEDKISNKIEPFHGISIKNNEFSIKNEFLSDISSESSHHSIENNKKRSTKSKCPPGLRSGKWTPEEELFTNKMIYYFRLGLLDIEDGTSLRWYLSKKLNCEAMRVTKKLKGDSSIGKQIYRSMDLTEERKKKIKNALNELKILENEFFISLNIKPIQQNSNHLKKKIKNISFNIEMKNMDQEKKNDNKNRQDAELLVHFCLTAHHCELKRKRNNEIEEF